ncbi:hypothetical protein V1525DRAFT_395077 [Lipomyces kononenkoae]|uniref:Uncharacterized protein n=1 Tax=Lipomyces kononenkoae TaxID=34357 RepID=A0ACC3T9W3_LIPKO
MNLSWYCARFGRHGTLGRLVHLGQCSAPSPFREFRKSSYIYDKDVESGKIEPSYYSLFPQTLKSGAPPNGPFAVDVRKLRREFLKLQSKTHPDLARTEEDKSQYESASSQLNKAYSTLASPLSRALYLLESVGMGIEEDAGREMPQDPELLMEVYELLEEIENCQSEEQAADLSSSIESRIRRTEKEVEESFDAQDLAMAKKSTVTLKYWVNIREALKEWEPGKPFRMVH